MSRDRIYQISFWFVSLMGLLYAVFQAGLFARAKQEGTVEVFSIYPDGTKEYIVNSPDGHPWIQLGGLTSYMDFSMVTFRILLISCLILPILITAWTEPDPIEKEDFVGHFYAR